MMEYPMHKSLKLFALAGAASALAVAPALASAQDGAMPGTTPPSMPDTGTTTPHDPSLTGHFRYGGPCPAGNRARARITRRRPVRAANVAERRQDELRLAALPVRGGASRLAPQAIVPYLFA